MPILEDQNCPNYTDKLEMGYSNYSSENINDFVVDAEFITNNSEYSEIASYEELTTQDSTMCFNVCGPNHYIENRGSRQICSLCPDKPQGWTQDNPTSETQEITDLRNSGLLGMCKDFNDNNINGIPEWFSRQQSSNMLKVFKEKINWNSDEAKLLWSHYNTYGDQNPAMTDQQLLAMFGSRVPGSFNEDNTPIYVLPSKYGNPSNKEEQIAALRIAINTGRGATIDCPGDPAATWATCSEGKFGVDDIIYEEAYDYWLSENDRLDPTTDTDTSGVLAFSDLMSGLSIDSNFESCVNEVLNTGENDKEIQDRINNYTKITDFNNEDINYLQGKLRQIILAKESDVNECMNMLNIGESVCTSGISDKMLQIGHLVISIIGANKINMRELDIDDRYKLNSMVDKLGPLLPQAIKNIIDISKQYETRVCNTPSNTTLLLERLYIDLYDKQTNVTLDLSSYVDFTSLIDTPNTMDGNVRFIKTILVIAVVGYVLVHLTDFVSKFLSRGSVKPE